MILTGAPHPHKNWLRQVQVQHEPDGGNLQVRLTRTITGYGRFKYNMNQMVGLLPSVTPTESAAPIDRNPHRQRVSVHIIKTKCMWYVTVRRKFRPSSLYVACIQWGQMGLPPITQPPAVNCYG